MSGRKAAILGLVGIAAALALFSALPFFADKFTTQFVTRIFIMAIFALSLDLLVGRTGLVSLGHAAYFGFAAYVLVLTAPQYEAANLWLNMALSIAGAAALALLIGALVLRTGGVYFIMATLAFGQMLFYLFHDTDIAGGSDGIFLYVRPLAVIADRRWFNLDDFTQLYFFVLACFIAVMALLGVLRQAPFGRVLDGIRVNEPRMRSVGYATLRYKLVCFVIAGALAGLAGYLSALQFGNVNPEMLGWQVSGSALMMVILGGKGTLIGPVVGAAAMLTMELAFQSWTRHWQLLMGLVIVAVVLALPGGLASLFKLSARGGERDEA